ncbi:MAG: 23S rRNA (uracil(1939)-C(5))-methyltransferase RlmD [Candidatus Kryptonium sp.]|nr:23S rRNA (uracil(1939)-C(5))-methyltransferase RlmD [Candidatus Kryptonium sp.]
MFQVGSEIEVKIEKTVFEGKSIARVNGFVLFVKNVVPGDVVRVKITKIKKSYAEAEPIEIIQSSNLRVKPRCKFFGICGGCKWQNLDYNAQIEFKRDHVIESFERIGGFKGIDKIVLRTLPSDEIYFYRNKIEFSFSKERWLLDEELNNLNEIDSNFALGFHLPDRYDKVLDIDECFLQSELSNEILNFTRNYFKSRKVEIYSTEKNEGYLRFLVIREGKNTGDVMVNLVTFEDNFQMMRNFTDALLSKFPNITTVINNINTRKAQVAVGEYEKVYHGNGTIFEKLGDFTFQISSNSFFQTNTRQAEKLYRKIVEFAEFNPDDVVYDFYSGTGTISIFISSYVKSVVGLEIVESAVEDAWRNAQINGVENCKFIAGDLRRKLYKDKDWIKEIGKPNVIIIDPPRSGMHPDVVKAVARIQPQKIIYVSCNPTTQARDIKMLIEYNPNYEIELVQPIDMFPHTYHIENIAVLKLVR